MEHFFKKFLPALLVAVGVFSGEADAACAGTVYFKPPSSWSSVYVAKDYSTNLVPSTQRQGEYYVIDLAEYAPNEGWGFTNFNLISGAECGSGVSKVNGTLFNTVGTTCEDYSIPCPGVGNRLYVTEDPLRPGTTYRGNYPPNVKFLYVLVPDDRDWQSDNMMISTDGGATGTKMEIAPGMCGWYQMTWEEVPEEVLIYPQHHPDQIVGMNGLWGNDANPTPIPLKTIMDVLGTNHLYFVPDDSQWPDGQEDAQGLFVVDPNIDGVCKFELAAVIYDTDQSLNPLFTSDGDNSGFGACIGVRHGIVKQDLGPNNKPVFNDDNDNAILCAGDENKFNTLFNYVAGVNEVQCYDMRFRHYGTDSRWGFDSDSTHYNLGGDELTMGGYTGGFYPLERSSAASLVTDISPIACDICRTKRKAEAPVSYIYTGDFDKYCNTYGWDGGEDCEGLFWNGNYPAVWDWGSRQDWTGVTRNQQFCFESHATFTYHEDQEFTFRGDDDIWVFINKKLALDNGGAHLAAPGHVVLKNLNTTYGANFLVPGNDYALDIFFCDRRTTMSNVIIKTNMFIKQSSGLSISTRDNGDGSVGYEVCYDQSGDGSCASVALGSVGGGATVHACGAEIASLAGKTIKYTIRTRAGETMATLSSGQSGWQYGGIDLSDPFNPKVNKNRITGLAPGSYRLVMDVCDASGSNCDVKARTYISFRITGNLDVMTQNSIYTTNAGDEKSPYYASGTKWTYRGSGVAGGRVPVYVSAFADGGVDLLSAVGQNYTLLLSSGLKAYTSYTGSTEVSFPKTINASGVDTIWIYMDPAEMTASPMKRRVSLKSTASIDFYATEDEYIVSNRALNKLVSKLAVVKRSLYVSGVKAGTAYHVFDMQGRLVKRGLFASSGAVVRLPHAGNYLVRIGGQNHKIQVK